MVLFPSFKTHRVTPVTRGVRYTLVSWARSE
jgi:predicted 2-oxoglutarate/Fe(II)-dependent dioxygenase YbiX